MTMAEEEVALVLEKLAVATRHLVALSRSVEASRLHFRPDGDAWSASAILAHLRACADMWGKSIIAMIQQDHLTLRCIFPRTWIRKTNYLALPFLDSLEADTRQRADLLNALQALPAGGRSRGATFTGTTKGRE